MFVFFQTCGRSNKASVLPGNYNFSSKMRINMQFSVENLSTCLVMNYCICTTGGQDVSNILAVSILFFTIFSLINVY